MANDFQLDGGTKRIDLGSGYALRAPGLKGKGRVLPRRAPGTRGPELATPEFDAAFARAGIDEVKVIELEVKASPPPPVAAPLRSADGTDALELAVPDLGPETGQVVLSIDEAGAMRWHFPVDEGLALQPATTRGVGAVKRFRITREVAPTPSAPPSGKRGLVSIIGRKILKVLVYPVTDTVLGPVTTHFIRKWEEENRPHALRRFAPNNRNPLGADDWTQLAGGRALLFIHGTFSTSRAAFGGLPEATLEALHQRYAGRLFAFDHPSLSDDPPENVRWFLSQVPAGVTLDLDVICHSRGGLVTRCLADRVAALGGDPARCSVRRCVLVGVPNRGTLLAEPDHMVDLLDRMTTVLNLFPDGIVTDVLESMLTVVKVVGHAGLVHLDGLAAMKPGGAFLTELNAPPVGPCGYYAVGADFEPEKAGLGASFGKRVADGFMDRVFENAANDLVVPTDGTYGDNGHPGFPLPTERYLPFSDTRGVTHTSYFSQPETSIKLMEWLV